MSAASSACSPPSFVYEPLTLEAAVDTAACCSVENTAAEGDDGVEIGSGVCVHRTGFILTAGHVASTVGDRRVVAFADGVTFFADCVAVSEFWDLALLKVQTVPPAASTMRKRKKAASTTRKRRKKESAGKPASFPFVDLSPVPPLPKEKLFCIGQPGRPRGERLEVSQGQVEKVCEAPLCKQDNVDTDGGLVHSCPAFAGNSGSALLLARTGRLAGLHTGYNFSRFTYQGTTLEAIASFLKPHGIVAPQDEHEDE